MDKLHPEDLPNIACAALENGLDSPALRSLAGLKRPTRRELGGLFDDACSQLGILPASAAAVEGRLSDQWIWDATQIARHLSSQILNGTLDPVEAWFQVPYREGELGPLAVFFEFADRSGVVSFDEEFRSRLLETAKRFQASAE